MLQPSVDEASRGLNEVVGASTRRCLRDQVRTRLSADKTTEGKIGETSTGELNVDPIGDESRAIRITIAYSAAGLDTSLYLDAVVFRQDRGLGLLTFVGLITPFDPELRASLSSRAARSLGDALQRAGRMTPP